MGAGAKSSLRVQIYNHVEDEHWLPAFADVHIACIKGSDTIAAFTSPLERNEVIRYWEERAVEAKAGKRIMVFALDGRELAGFVTLALTMTQTQPFLGNIEKLLVSPNHRKR